MKESLRKKMILIYWWAPPFLIAAIQFGLSSWSSPPRPPIVFPGWDKVAHGLVYFVMAAATFRAIRGYNKWPFKKALKAAMILCILYGLMDEMHQCFVPDRTPEWRDWIADAVGSFLGALAWFAWEQIAPKPLAFFRSHHQPGNRPELEPELGIE